MDAVRHVVLLQLLYLKKISWEKGMVSFLVGFSLSGKVVSCETEGDALRAPTSTERLWIRTAPKEMTKQTFRATEG